MTNRTTNEKLEATRSALKRRAFLTGVGTAAAAAVSTPLRAGGQVDVAPDDEGSAALSGFPNPSARIRQSYEMRVAMARENARMGPAVNVNNGDFERYQDRGGVYTKALPHDAYGRVEPAAFATLMTALSSGRPSDFENITMGGTRTLNGPQGALAFDMEAMDNVQFGQPEVPPAPKVAGHHTATELVEMYWASLLRDVAFSEYGSNAMVAEAAAELSSLRAYRGPRDAKGQVTPSLLFRGNFPGETLGPYQSQFLLQPTFFGSQPIGQQQLAYVPGIDYGTDFASWLDIQNGVDTGQRNEMESQLRFRRNGRDFCSLTHMDVLFQEYFTACMVLAGINPAAPGSFSFGGAPLNPGNPYMHSKTQNGFGSFGPPDIAATVEEVACKALNAVWYQKWYVHMRPRPEAIAGIVHLLKTGQENRTDVRLSEAVLNSKGLAKSYAKYGSYLLSLAFPEGSPAHPAYPTGHGTVAGACITVLKFFWDGDFVVPNPVAPASDGLSLMPYTGTDAGQLTVAGELNKLGHNVTFAHGIHAGIHWRSDSDTSLLFGEAVALSFLRDKARTYNEPFTVRLTKFDGTTATISNPGPTS